MSGQVVRVSGPLVETEGLTAAMSELVSIGRRRIAGEVVGIAGGRHTLQAYEDTGGLVPGERVASLGAPVSASLGPGLLGGVFDGLLRPLSAAGVWLAAGEAGETGSAARWRFAPGVRVGQRVGPGDQVGTVTSQSPVTVRVLVPPGVEGVLTRVREPGECAPDSVVACVGEVEVPLTQAWPVRRPRPVRERVGLTRPLHTGQRVLDLLFPVARGSSAAVPGGFGTGKTILLQQIAKWCDADVIVYVGCGERGNEMADVVSQLTTLDDPRTGGTLAHRTVVIANTSHMPMMAREVSIYTGVTVAEYFRDMGYDVVVIADSTSRWAEALREFASRTGVLPAEEGYPATLGSALAAFYERAGAVSTLGGRDGSVTIVSAVSPPGGDLAEPVTAHTERFVRSVWLLDRDLAYARHYPAVTWSGSFCRDAAALAERAAEEGDPAWAERRTRVLALLAEADRLQALSELVGVTSMPGPERIAILAGRLLREGVLQQSALSARDAYSDVRRSAALVDAVVEVVDRGRDLVLHGVPADRVEEVDFGPVVRAREEAADLEEIAAQRERVLAALDALDRGDRA